MPVTELFTAKEVAEILGTSPGAIRMALSRGQEGISIPPSIKLGFKRRWRRKEVYAWLDKAAAHTPQTRRGRPRRQATGKLRRDLSVKRQVNNGEQEND